MRKILPPSCVETNICGKQVVTCRSQTYCRRLKRTTGYPEDTLDRIKYRAGRVPLFLLARIDRDLLVHSHSSYCMMSAINLSIYFRRHLRKYDLSCGEDLVRSRTY
jgi:hypothetical protein